MGDRALSVPLAGTRCLSVKSLPLEVVQWGVIVVVLYTAVTLIRSAFEDRRALAATRAISPASQ